MKFILCFLLLCMLASQVQADPCQNNFTLSDLLGGLLAEASSMLFYGTQVKFTGCPNGAFVRDSDVKFLLYTRPNSIKPKVLDPNYPVQVNPKKPTIILLPGWTCNVTNDRMPQLKNAYLRRYDCNLIAVDWSLIATDFYVNAFCNAKPVAEIIATFLCNLQFLFHIKLSKIHLVGQSMGAQLAGLVGQEVQKQCQRKIGRITGLDPAGPIYNFQPISDRLDESDALFVDVIHTNMGGLGYVGSCGSVDFYPYCGVYQPGCAADVELKNILNLPLHAAVCSHLRSADYMIESIDYGQFLGTPCFKCTLLVCLYNPFAGIEKDVQMGEYCSKNVPHRNYYTQRG